MGYYIDLEKVTINDYRKKLETAYLPPSRKVLRERLDERFECFEKLGIQNVKELLQLLKKKKSFEELQKTECFTVDYLKILLRELNSTLPKPNKLSDFKGISKDTVIKLEKIGIKNTFKLYDRIITPEYRQVLSLETGISDSELLKLTKLTDLSRIKWAGATFAGLLLDLGVDTVENVSKTNPVELHKLINQINKEKSIYKGQIGLNDIRIFVDAAKEVPREIEY